MKKQTSELSDKLDELFDKIESLEDAVWSLYDMQTEEQVIFVTDFVIDDKGFH